MTCVVFYHSAKYDVGEFVDTHPGGREIIVELENKDITSAYDDIGHSKSADRILSKYLIREGTTTTTDIQPIAPASADNELELKRVTSKLFTSEDTLHVHKVLGISCLLHFMYRYLYVLPRTNTLGYGSSFRLDTVTLLLHLGLSYSSILFHVLKARIPERPLIIYAEYRLHAMVFTTRGVLISLVGVYAHLIPSAYRQACVLLIVLSTSLAVDVITSKYGTPGITAVRNNSDGTLVPLRLAYAYYQFIALGSLLHVDVKSGDLGFNVLIAIQSSAFLMTLKRKGLIRCYSHAFWYSFALCLSSYYIWYVKGSLFMLHMMGLFFIRTQLSVSKYLIWTCYVGASFCMEDGQATNSFT